MVRQIAGIYKAFLWKSKAETKSPGLIAWDKLCISKLREVWGFGTYPYGIKQLYLNTSGLLRRKKIIYGCTAFITYTYKGTIYGSIKLLKIMAIRDEFKEKELITKFLEKRQYKVNMGYKALMERNVKIRWSKQVLNRLNSPKHAFILWLVLKGRLQTKN